MRRVTDKRANESRRLFRENAAKIFRRTARAKPGTYLPLPEGLVHIDDLADAQIVDRLRARDATNQPSVAMGCALSQIPEMNRRFSKHGVKFVPNPKHGETAVCRWKNRQSRLKYMKATGRHCFEETQG